jgi:peroxidase
MMKSSSSSCCVMMALVVVVAAGRVSGKLSMEYYYMQGCPMAEMIVRDVMGDAIMKDPTLAASIRRLHFHDCFVQGCDASLLLDFTPPGSTTAEKDAPPNRTLLGFEVIDAIKEALEERCPSVVSCADILALAARDAVLMARAPYYDVPTGRRDGFRSDAADTVALPAATLNASALVELFGSRGFTVPELVALSGGHTLGVAHCANFKNRLVTNDVEPSLEPSLAASLASTCSSGGDGATAPFDMTSEVFDTAYFSGLQETRSLLTSDQTLAGWPETGMLVNMFAEDRGMFFYTFQQGTFKMGQLDLKEDGDVRKSCRVLN